jgi:hypothetical protein
MANFFLLMAIPCAGVGFTSYTARNALDASDGSNWATQVFTLEAGHWPAVH